MVPESIGRLQIANHLLSNRRKLRDSLEEYGYLYFSDVLDTADVDRVKAEFVRVLQRQGIVEVGHSDPVWTGTGLDQIDDNELYAQSLYEALLGSRHMSGLMESVLGGPVFMYRNTDIRFSLPGDSKHLTPAHQDHYFIRQTADFVTVWVPLMAIDREVGGLALAPWSHRSGLIDHVEHESAYSYIFRGRKQRGVPPEQVPAKWLTADYRPGDVLVFHSLTIHRALPNRSNRIRLSLDTRFQPASSVRTWQAEKTTLELRQYRSDVRRIATADGISEPLFETILIEMMKRGRAVDRECVRAMASELQPTKKVNT